MQIQKQKQNKQGFTMIEILLVIAIIAILASAILVGISGQREKARTSKVLMELSATLQPMMMCWSDGETVVIPSAVAGGGNICSGDSSYGTWPVISSEGWFFTTRTIDTVNHTFTLRAAGGESRIQCLDTTDSCEEY
jgi:prepilin-type N-terminal cleavage/methylation domain-containing protein